MSSTSHVANAERSLSDDATVRFSFLGLIGPIAGHAQCPRSARRALGPGAIYVAESSFYRVLFAQVRCRPADRERTWT